MSKAKYSPSLTREMIAAHNETTFIYNCKGEIAPTDWADGEYNDIIHFGNYDSEGFDTYGYSAWLKNGKFAGHGNGADRWGYTEDDYDNMDDDEFNDLSWTGPAETWSIPRN